VLLIIRFIDNYPALRERVMRLGFTGIKIIMSIQSWST